MRIRRTGSTNEGVLVVLQAKNGVAKILKRDEIGGRKRKGREARRIKNELINELKID